MAGGKKVFRENFIKKPLHVIKRGRVLRSAYCLMKHLIVKEGWPFIFGLPLLLIALAGLLAWSGVSQIPWLFFGLAVAAAAGLIYYFREPQRVVDVEFDPGTILSGADGMVSEIELVEAPLYLDRPAVRVRVSPGPLDARVNRCPIPGELTRIRTDEPTSEQPCARRCLLIHGERTDCLMQHIVEPVVRRAFHWIDRGLARGKRFTRGERIGRLKFGSRLDVYLPAEDVEILVASGERVLAGVTAIARLKRPKRKRNPAGVKTSGHDRAAQS